MDTGTIVSLILGAVGAPLLVAAIVGGGKWAAAMNRAVTTSAQQSTALVAKLGDLAADVRELAVAAQDTVLLRAEFRGHCAQAEERWTLLLGRAVPTPRDAYEGDERRRHPRVIEVTG